MRMQAIQRRRKSPGKKGLGCRCSSDSERKISAPTERLGISIRTPTSYWFSREHKLVSGLLRREGRSQGPPSPRNHFLSGIDNRGVRGIRAQFWFEWPLREADNSERIS